MSRRAKIILISLVLLVVGIEMAVRLAHNSRSGVEIANLGQSAIENMVVSFGGTRVAVGKIAPGDSAQVWLSGKGTGTLSLSFTQVGNPMSGFVVPDYDPEGMHPDGLRMVLQISTNQVTKFMDEESTATPLGQLRDRIYDWIRSECSFLR